MKLSSITILALAGTIISAAQSSSTTPGYFTDFTTLPNDTSFSFGKNYAVLNLDLIVGIVSGLNSTCEGQKFIDSISTWIDAVHAQSPPPLTIFTRIFFSNSAKPEIGPSTPFRTPSAALGDAASPATMLYPAFVPEGNDLVLQKTRYYAGAGNGLEEILSSQGIDTVILSGIRTSGVILSATYRLFDLNYKVFVISNNTIESSSDKPGIDKAIKEGVMPKLPVDVITLEQALAALDRSGPAVF